MTNITTPVGRVVWGHPTKGRQKTDNDDKPVFGDDGKPVIQYAFGLAIPKTLIGEVQNVMRAEAATIFPQGAPSGFAWKVADGDGLDSNGKPFNTREGYAGCFVLAISTESFAPRVVRYEGGAYVAHDQIKCGDFVRLALDVKAHASNPKKQGSKPGLYLNPGLIQFVGYGTEIVNGPDPMTAFGNQPVALPPGASATPIVPTAPLPGFGAPGAAPAAANPVAPSSGFPGSSSPTASPSSGFGSPAPATAAPPGFGAPAAPAAPGFGTPAAPAAPGGFAPHPGFVANAQGQPVPPGFTPPPAAPAAPPGPGQPGYVPRWVQDAAGFYDANIGPHARYVPGQ